MKQEESMGRPEVTVDKNVYDSCILIDNIIVLQNKKKTDKISIFHLSTQSTNIKLFKRISLTVAWYHLQKKKKS